MSRQDTGHEEVDRLLPWYANETLDDAERQGVRHHLDQCAECRENLTLLMQMQRAVNDHQAVAMVPEPRRADLLEKIDSIEQKKGAKPNVSRWMLAASLVIFAVTAMVFFSTPIDRQVEPQFRTVTSSEQVGQVGFVLNLTFVADSTAAKRGQLIAELGATVLAVSNNNTFQIMVPMPAVSIADLEAFTGDLLRRPEVQAAEVVALQLPVRSEKP